MEGKARLDWALEKGREREKKNPKKVGKRAKNSHLVGRTTTPKEQKVQEKYPRDNKKTGRINKEIPQEKEKKTIPKTGQMVFEKGKWITKAEKGRWRRAPPVL